MRADVFKDDVNVSLQANVIGLCSQFAWIDARMAPTAFRTRLESRCR